MANRTCKIFTVFQQNLPYKTAKTATGPSCATPKPVCGGPCGHPGSGKIKNILYFIHFGVPGKNTSRKAPPKPQNARKSKFRKIEAVSSKNFDYDHMVNLLRLTDGLGNFGSGIDGPEIWPGHNRGGRSPSSHPDK